MISISAWKRELGRPTPSPRSGPASQSGQPPLWAGTYCEGAEAAPALIKKTLVRTPTSPSAPNAHTVRLGADGPLARPVRGSPRWRPEWDPIVAAPRCASVPSGRYPLVKAVALGGLPVRLPLLPQRPTGRSH